MSRVIGLGGWMTAGKDAVADRLVEKHGWAKIGMSDALLDAALELDPWIPSNTEPPSTNIGEWGHVVRLSWLIGEVGYVEAKKNPEVRRFMQKLGTDVGREMISEDVWVRIVRRRIEALRSAGASVAVTGMRFPNELNLIDRIHGESIWVHRPGVAAPAFLAGHASEQSVGPRDFDRIIRNDGTLEDLFEKVDALA